jgi:hypothetical protein
MRVISDGYFDIYVYSNEVFQRHHLPHCHVRSPNGDVIIELPTLNILAGSSLSKRARKLLLENINLICESWNELNPELSI